MRTSDALRKIADKLDAGENPQDWGAALMLIARCLLKGKITNQE